MYTYLSYTNFTYQNESCKFCQICVFCPRIGWSKPKLWILFLNWLLKFETVYSSLELAAHNRRSVSCRTKVSIIQIEAAVSTARSCRSCVSCPTQSSHVKVEAVFSGPCSRPLTSFWWDKFWCYEQVWMDLKFGQQPRKSEELEENQYAVRLVLSGWTAHWFYL